MWKWPFDWLEAVLGAISFVSGSHFSFEWKSFSSNENQPIFEWKPAFGGIGVSFCVTGSQISLG